MATDPLLSVAEELYALAPEDFTGTRNQWAKQTKADGDTGLAKRIAALRKPATAAWVVNMLMRHQGEQMTQVLELGASLRQAQADLDAEALRELTRQRRQLTLAVSRQGKDLARELGQRVSDAVADQVQDTLHAAMIDEGAADAVRSGLLVGPLAATGVGQADVVDAVAVPEAIGLTARPRTKVSRPVPKRPELSVVKESEEDRAERERQEREAARAEAQERVDEAQAAAEDAEQRLRKAARKVQKLQARTLQTADELEEVRRRVAELEHALEGLDEQAAAAEERRERAEEEHATAQQELEEARQALDDLD